MAKYLLCALSFVSAFFYAAYGQSRDGALRPRHENKQPQPIPKQELSKSNSTPVFSFCDEDSDGFLSINIDSIQTLLLKELGQGFQDRQAILIGTRFGNVLKVEDIETFEPTVTVEDCVPSFTLTDIAIDPNRQLFACGGEVVYSFDENCERTLLLEGNFGYNLYNSLSFDFDGNLYYGDDFDSKVFRAEAGDLTNFKVWHDFKAGKPGGDFVQLNGKMYISWVVEGVFKLYEVTVNNRYEYVSHRELADLPHLTYGLAVEYGKLYGVTTKRLFEVDFDTFNYPTIIENQTLEDDWYGASGLHESVLLEATMHLTEAEANSGTAELSDSWVNTVEGGQTVYLRIVNLITGEYKVYPVEISVNNDPIIARPIDLVFCQAEETAIFNLTDIEPSLMIANPDDFLITYHLNSLFVESGSFPVISPLAYSNLQNPQPMYVRVTNKQTGCYEVADFRLVINKEPEILPIETVAENRLVTNCYIDKNGRGYFKLNEAAQSLTLNPDREYEITFYQSFEDAESSNNRLNNEFYTTLGTAPQVFARFQTPAGCVGVTNFYLDGNCQLYSNDVSNIYFPKFFTPNNDGYNDFWNYSGVSQRLFATSTVTIFDRYGRPLTIYNPGKEQGWNGLYGNNPVPSSDYWYKVELNDGRTFTGHFSLKR